MCIFFLISVICLSENTTLYIFRVKFKSCFYRRKSYAKITRQNREMDYSFIWSNRDILQIQFLIDPSQSTVGTQLLLPNFVSLCENSRLTYFSQQRYIGLRKLQFDILLAATVHWSGAEVRVLLIMGIQSRNSFKGLD